MEAGMLTTLETLYISTAMAMPDSKLKLAHLKILQERYKDYYPFCAFKSEALTLDNMIRELESKYGEVNAL
jgi:hypothetical protein